MGEKWLSPVKKPTILILAIYVELYILLFLCDLHYPGRAAYLFLSKRTRIVLAPEQFNVVLRTGMIHYGIE